MCPRTRVFAHSSSPLFFSFFCRSLALRSRWPLIMVLSIPNKCSRYPARSSASVREAIRPWSRKCLCSTFSCFELPWRCVERLGVDSLGARALHSRVAICDYRGNPVLECYVVPTMAVTDYRTSTTGITSAHLSSGRSTPKKKRPLAALSTKGAGCLFFQRRG
jgi:hypothetical protein